jgi:pyrroline-5-carboxylate reductase
MLENVPLNIFFLGCGSMGGAILQVIQNNQQFCNSQISVVKPTTNNLFSNVAYFSSYQELPINYQADIVFLAIKPQEATNLLPLLAMQNFLQPHTIIITMLAGKKLAFYEQIFAKNTKIIRIMPNLNIEVNCGIVAFFANNNVTCEDLTIFNNIFIDSAKLFALTTEKKFDVATALFGCGPAYLFLLQEIFNQIAIKYNINQPELMIDLFLGSAIMMKKNNKSPVVLQQLVASKKGATASALAILKKQNQLQNIFQKAIAEAIKTSAKL